ncbi:MULTISPECIES: hypothetical protein [unclassified Nocardia]|uniref:hypothetical protein n=1 Tax=unclassified Nocardia TaxID=2637762 RepID=UPI00278C0C93|nr:MULTISPECIES: hypothetical protein [unclassified Nocardia]
MAGERLTYLRAELARIGEQIEAALVSDPDADTTDFEDQAELVQDELDAILEVMGAQAQQEIQARPPKTLPPLSERLF